MAQFDDPVMDLPPEYYSAIGEFMFRYAQLEYQMHEIVWMAFDLGYKKGRILTIGTDARVLVGMISNIAGTDLWIRNPTRKQEMNSVAGTARKYYVLRNRIAHGSWQAPRGDPKQARLHFMKESEFRLMPRFDPTLDVGKIHKNAGALRNANLKAKRLISALQEKSA